MIRWFAFVVGLILTLMTTMSASADPSANEVAAIFAGLKSENAPGAAVLVAAIRGWRAPPAPLRCLLRAAP